MKVEQYVCDVCARPLVEGDEYVALKENDGIICRHCYEAKMFPTEVYSRVVGYIRPVAQWNKGKQAEWKDRVVYKPGVKKVKVHMD
jgi:anaerobic ribonucleoside-triphosphate reductase